MKHSHPVVMCAKQKLLNNRTAHIYPIICLFSIIHDKIT